MKPTTMLVCAWVAATLSACGGGAGNPADPPPTAQPEEVVPPSASVDPQGMATWLKSLNSQSGESNQPVLLDGYAPAQSDTNEPEPL